MYRDQHTVKPSSPPVGYGELVTYLNEINREWVTAMRRLSTRLLFDWLEDTHEDYVQCLEKLNPLEETIYAVSWAGQKASPNWFHIAREYTEKWHHQQQIRDAVDKPGILTAQFYPLVLETFMKAIPYRYRNVETKEGATIEIVIPSDAGGRWIFGYENKRWNPLEPGKGNHDAVITFPAEISWKLFTKAISADQARKFVLVDGDSQLAEPLLNMITVMA
jgi:hypothetical protein